MEYFLFNKIKNKKLELIYVIHWFRIVYILLIYVLTQFSVKRVYFIAFYSTNNEWLI